MASSGDGGEKQGPGFTIIDRRGQRDEQEAPAEEQGREEPRAEALPPVDFASLLMSFATSALYHLGEIADPETGQRPDRNLPLARQTIDALEVLEEKSRGNRTQEEEELLTHLLTDLRMRFVQATQSG
jgi:hypothetical protein